MTIQYDPQKVTDWVTPLEKVYARQSQQLDRYHNQLRERDRQEQAATLDLPEMVSKLASFSKTIGQVVEARKTGQKRKTADTLGGFMITGVDNDSAIEYYKKRYQLGKDDLLKDNKDLEKLLSNIKDDDFREYIRNSSKKQHILNKEFLALEYTKSLPGKYKTYINGDGQVEYDALQGEQARKDHFTKYADEALAPLELSKEIVANNILPEVAKLRDTEAITKRIQIKNRVYAVKTIALENSIDVNRNLSGDEAANNLQLQLNTLASDFGGEMEPAKEEATRMLVRLGRGRKLEMHEWNAILEGKIEHPSGNTGAILLSDDQKLQVHKAILEGQAVELANHKANIGTQIESDTLQAISGKISQDQLDGKIRYYESIGENERIKQLKNISVVNQNEVVYQNEVEQLTETAKTGNLELLKAEVEGATNLTAKAEAEKEIAFQEKQRKKLNYSERFLDVKVSEGLNLTLKTDEALNWKGIGVRNDLLAFFRKDFATRIKADPNNPNALGESMQAVEDYWEANGGNEQGGVGKFSPTSNGTYDNFNNYNNLKSEAYTELNTVATESNVKKYTDRVNTAWNKAKYDTITKGKNIIQRVLNTPESILDKEDIIAAYENTTISSEVRIKARELGITPTQLLEWQTKALINGGDNYKEIVDLFDLKNKELPDPEKDLQDMIDDQDLLYLLRRVGIENTTPKQRFRLYQYLENSEASVKEKNIENTLSESSNTQPDIGRYSTRSN
jgi:hypothetical protein